MLGIEEGASGGLRFLKSEGSEETNLSIDLQV
jgi:hypothetical protein